MDSAVAAGGAERTNEWNPSTVDQPWPRIVIALLSLTGLITPVLCLIAAPVAFALSDQDDGFLLAGIGGAHLLLTWGLFGTV